MKKVIGIVSEGPTDYLVLKEVIDKITGEENRYLSLQPEPDMLGRYGNGWKGVWRWCKETEAISLYCEKTVDKTCPVELPCMSHEKGVEAVMGHGKLVLESEFENEDMTHIAITIPCDSTDAWVVAAYDELDEVEMFTDPWNRIIAKGKYYHGIRVRSNKKNTNTYQHFSVRVARCWNTVKEKCKSAGMLEQEVRRILM